MIKTYYSHDQIQGLTQEILRQMQKDNWKPDYVVGLTRGGLLPALYISHYLDIPMETLKIKLRDHADTESNLWMSEDAFGYIPVGQREDAPLFEGQKSTSLEISVDSGRRKNILIVDDINDSGATLNWLMEDWQTSCLPNDKRWNHVWGQNVRFAVLVDNVASGCKVKMDYAGTEINKAELDEWIVFPFEQWWN